MFPTRWRPVAGHVEVRFGYDYLGRRIEKIVSEYRTTPTADWYETGHRAFIWAGWLMLMELQDYGTPSEPNFQPVRKYTWGLDLAGQNGQVNSLEGAGGILDSASHRQGQVGGLLAVYDLNDTPGNSGDDLKYVYTYDGTGNVGQVLNWTTGAMKACYQYDPYGRVLNPTGPYVSRNPFRFSTKYWDDWFGLGYWGYRWYSPVLGRWTSRDPLGEAGAARLAGGKFGQLLYASELAAEPNVYGYCRSRPMVLIDADGRLSGCCGPDVTASVNHLVDAIAKRFNDLHDNPRQQQSICLGMFSNSGWDIDQLANSGRAAGFAGFEQAGCGTDSCRGTIKYNGICYRSAEVNYYLWGKLNSLCRSSLSRWAKLKRIEYWEGGGLIRWRESKEYWETEDGISLPEGVFTCSWAASKASEWFALGGIVDGLAGTKRTDPGPAGSGTGECRAAWTRAGCSGTGIPQECIAEGCGNECCKDAYSGQLSGHMGSITVR